MEIIRTEIEGVLLIKPKVFADARGYFVESYSEKLYQACGICTNFIQDNESMSMKAVLRGLHYQDEPYAQAKLVRVVRGAVWDVAVDIRKGSPTFGKYVSALLTAENKQQLYIPRGFAHGFLVMEDNTIFSYKCDQYYEPKAERGIKWDDPCVNILWPSLDAPFVLSAKDKVQPLLNDVIR